MHLTALSLIVIDNSLAQRFDVKWKTSLSRVSRWNSRSPVFWGICAQAFYESGLGGKPPAHASSQCVGSRPVAMSSLPSSPRPSTARLKRIVSRTDTSDWLTRPVGLEVSMEQKHREGSNSTRFQSFHTCHLLHRSKELPQESPCFVSRAIDEFPHIAILPFRLDFVNSFHFSRLSNFSAIPLRNPDSVKVGALAILIPQAKTSVILSPRRSLNGNLVATGARTLACFLVKMTLAFVLWTRILVCLLLFWSSELVMVIEAKSKDSKLVIRQQGETYRTLANISFSWITAVDKVRADMWWHKN